MRSILRNTKNNSLMKGGIILNLKLKEKIVEMYCNSYEVWAQMMAIEGKKIPDKPFTIKANSNIDAKIAEIKNDNEIEDTIDNIFNSIELEDDEQVELTKLNTLKYKLDDASIVLNKIEEIKREISETEEMISSHKASIKDNSELNNIRREAKEVTISLHKIFHDTKK